MSRILLSAVITAALIRRNRRGDDAIFGILQVQDRERFDRRDWTVYVNDISLIEQLEALRIGEPIAIAGPFTASPSRDGREVYWRMTAEAVLCRFPSRFEPKSARFSTS